jgi:hypothetical protein
MKSVFRSDGAKLIPLDQDGLDFCAKNSGREIMMEGKAARNPGHHKKFFALMNLLWTRTICGEAYASREQMRKAIFLAAGVTEIIPTRKGDVEVPRSLAFESMDQTEFDQVYNACIAVIIKEILPHMTDDDLRHELLEFAA